MSGLINVTGSKSGVIGTTVAPMAGGGLAHVLTGSMPGSDSTGSIFATFNDNTYNAFHVVMKDIELVNDAVEWRMNFTNSSGGRETGNGYWTALEGFTSGSTGYTVGLQPATYIRIGPNLGSATGEAFNGMFTLTGMRNTAAFAMIQGVMGWSHGNNMMVSAALSGIYQANPATAFHGFELNSISGSFAGGSISVYGYKTS